MTLSAQQIESFVRDGYLVLPDIISQQAVSKAQRALVEVRRNGDDESRRSAQAATRELVTEGTQARELVESAMGGTARGWEFAQIAIRQPSKPSDQITESGYPDRVIPFFGWHGHLDGLWNGASAPHQHTSRPMDDTEWAAWSKAKGRNGVMKTYPGTGTNMVHFTALLGIPLSSQTRDGVGNLGLLRGAHHPVAEFFRYQRDQGGPLGPDGPGWERLHRDAPNGYGLRHYPDQVRRIFTQEAAYTDDGHLWPKPDLIKMEIGDAVLTLHAIPHSASRCETDEPRVMAYFRLTSGKRPKTAGSNYPDALCDCWLEWDGIRSEVQEILRAGSV